MKNFKKAFSLIELSIVILIIGILVAGVTQSSRLIKQMRLATAIQITNSSGMESIPDMVMWLEATEDFAFATGTNASFNFSTNTYTDIDRPSDQDRIGRWNDIVARNNQSKNSAIQNNLSRQPKYIESGINNLPSLHFDATTSQAVCMHSPVNIDRVLVPNLSMFIVYIWTTIDTGTTQKLWGADNGGWDRQAIFSSPFGGVSNGGSATAITNFQNRNVGQIFSYISKVGVTNGSTAYINASSSPVTFTESNSSVGYPAITIPGNNNQSNGVTLDGICSENTNVIIGEFILFDRALKAEERSSVEKYLSKKWGIKI
jgi:prepilin-type N-terminal cleavage/methylation domain-containing protein